jgi:Ring finger domain
MGPDISGVSNQPQLDAASSISSLAALSYPQICVICLDRVSEKAIALPCGHDQFDFPCLGTWLQQQCVCPLCKTEVKAIRYDITKPDNYKIFNLPNEELPRRSSSEIEQRRRQHRPAAVTPFWRAYSPDNQDQQEAAVNFRRRIYHDRLYSLHVGTNKFSRYRNITHFSFLEDDHLLSRARNWVRRELAVFEFLNPESASFGSTERRASNTEYLLEYIIAILRSVDIRGNAGQAEELLKDFLGRDTARLFLHELEAWLRSPYEKLEDWDKNVQYNDGSVRNASKNAGGAFQDKPD